MVSRSYDEGDNRKSHPHYRNEENFGGRGAREEEDYPYPPRIYGRESYGQEDRFAQRAGYGYRDADPLTRSASTDAFRGYEGPGGRGYGSYRDDYAVERGGPGGYDEHAAAQWRRSQFGTPGPGGDAGAAEPAPEGGQFQGRRDKSRQFDPDYHQWRDEQLSALDKDYQAWRSERYRKFADEFSQWRSGRSRVDEEGRGKGGEKENPGKSK